MTDCPLCITKLVSVYESTTSAWARPLPKKREIDGLVFMIDGSITYHFEEESGTAHPGDLLVFPKSLCYWGEKNSAEQHFMVIDFITDEFHSLDGMRLPRIVSGCSEVLGLFRQCADIWRQGGREASLGCAGIILQIIAETVCHISRSSVRSKELQPVIQYIREHFADPELDVTRLSELFGIAPCRLRRLFDREMGMPPLRYILDRRMELAQNLLRHEGLSVHEVAVKCGFSSEFYFSRYFKQRFGIPPSRFV